MTRNISIHVLLIFLLTTLSASAGEVHFQAALPGETGRVALTFTLDEAGPSGFDNYFSLARPTILRPRRKGR